MFNIHVSGFLALFGIPWHTKLVVGLKSATICLIFSPHLIAYKSKYYACFCMSFFLGGWFHPTGRWANSSLLGTQMVSFLTCYGGMCGEEWAEYMTAISHFTSPAWVQSTHHHPDLYKLQRPGTIIDLLYILIAAWLNSCRHWRRDMAVQFWIWMRSPNVKRMLCKWAFY